MQASGSALPRVMNVDRNPAYLAAVEALKADGGLPCRVQLRQCKSLNNVIEQDHRNVKKRAWLLARKRATDLSARVANLTRHRNNPHDSERKSEVAAGTRCGERGSVRSRAVRPLRLLTVHTSIIFAATPPNLNFAMEPNYVAGINQRTENLIRQLPSNPQFICCCAR